MIDSTDQPFFFDGFTFPTIDGRPALITQSQVADCCPLSHVELSSLGWLPQWFGDHPQPWPAGTYEVKWVSGVVGFSPILWGIGILRNLPLIPSYNPPFTLDAPYRFGGPQILTSTASAVDNAYDVPPRVDWAGPLVRYTSEADALAAAHGQRTRFLHPGGPIGMAVMDHNYTDNLPSAQPLRFALHCVR